MIRLVYCNTHVCIGVGNVKRQQILGSITQQRHVLCAFVVTFTLVLFALAFASNASAAVGVKVQPIKVSTTIEAGGEATGFIMLNNESDELGGVIIETGIEDFVPLEGGSNINFVGRAEGLTTAADWISLDVPEQFEMAHAEGRQVKYTIRAPDDAEPGSHFSVVFFKALKKDDQGQLKVGTRVGILFFITIPGNYEQKGQIESFEAPGFVDSGPVPFTLHFKNTGTVHYEPKGTIVVKNMFGRIAGEVPVQGQVVLPTGARDINAAWPASRFLMGKYTATVAIYDGEGNELTAQAVDFWAFPVNYAIYFVAALLLLYVILRLFRRYVNISVTVGGKE